MTLRLRNPKTNLVIFLTSSLIGVTTSALLQFQILNNFLQIPLSGIALPLVYGVIATSVIYLLAKIIEGIVRVISTEKYKYESIKIIATSGEKLDDGVYEKVSKYLMNSKNGYRFTRTENNIRRYENGMKKFGINETSQKIITDFSGNISLKIPTNEKLPASTIIANGLKELLPLKVANKGLKVA